MRRHEECSAQQQCTRDARDAVVRMCGGLSVGGVSGALGAEKD